VLSPYFGGMIAFVKDVELQLERRETIRVDECKLISILRDRMMVDV
jgi:hypothetical protein